MTWSRALFCAAVAVALAAPPASADSISEVEGARAKERAGRHLNRQDVEKLRRYGGNDDHRAWYSHGGYYGYDPAYPYAGTYSYDSRPYSGTYSYRSYPY